MKAFFFTLLASLGLGSHRTATDAQIIAELNKPAQSIDAPFKSHYKTKVIVVSSEVKTETSEKFNSIESIINYIMSLSRKTNINSISAEYSDSQGSSSWAIKNSPRLKEDLAIFLMEGNGKRKAPQLITITMATR